MGNKNTERLEKQYWVDKDPCEYAKGIGGYARERDYKIVAMLAGRRGGSALDIPCGEGRHSLLLKELGYDVTSADINAKMLKVCRRKAGTRTIMMDIFKVPEAHYGKYNFILMTRLLFHYQPSSQFTILKNVSKLLAPGGVFVFDTLNKYSVRWIVHVLLVLVGKRVLGEQQYQCERVIYFSQKKDVLKLIAGAGFRDVMDRYGGYLLPTRLYRFIPRPLYPFFDLVENVFPDRLKVLSFWKVKKVR